MVVGGFWRVDGDAYLSTIDGTLFAITSCRISHFPQKSENYSDNFLVGYKCWFDRQMRETCLMECNAKWNSIPVYI